MGGGTRKPSAVAKSNNIFEKKKQKRAKKSLPNLGTEGRSENKWQKSEEVKERKKSQKKRGGVGRLLKDTTERKMVRNHAIPDHGRCTIAQVFSKSGLLGRCCKKNRKKHTVGWADNEETA